MGFPIFSDPTTWPVHSEAPTLKHLLALDCFRYASGRSRLASACKVSNMESKLSILAAVRPICSGPTASVDASSFSCLSNLCTIAHCFLSRRACKAMHDGALAGRFKKSQDKVTTAKFTAFCNPIRL